jgi:hypothetical protein
MKNILNFFLSIIFVALFVVNIYKACTISMTHDESISYELHARQPIEKILTSDSQLASNNHLINTLWIKFIQSFDDNVAYHEGILRITSTVGMVLCFIVVFSCLRKNQDLLATLL